MAFLPADQLKRRIVAIRTRRHQAADVLDDVAYRTLLQRTAGVTSSTAIRTLAQAEKVLAEFDRRGIGKTAKATKGRAGGRPHNLSRVDMLQKIEALLADMELPWAYADSIARRQTKQAGGIERLAWVPDDDLVGVIAALHRQKLKRINESLAALKVELGRRSLNMEWARCQAEDMGRLDSPWPWLECLQTQRLLLARLAA
ncbi:hypothetical protein AZSI13_32660 [Azospira sp. I13]|uniref:regulatory protein GemA n=1 Tax=Azospira sp. I13 TaxID=1765050 RepID=UPI000D48681A|nr:regulatory protein GemA [Azospira sp. I13]GBG03939.1 hypothetical protein AZSI13_32660 [Azospira sp. I13]